MKQFVRCLFLLPSMEKRTSDAFTRSWTFCATMKDGFALRLTYATLTL